MVIYSLPTLNFIHHDRNTSTTYDTKTSWTRRTEGSICKCVYHIYVSWINQEYIGSDSKQ
jgi:hypothetical protein